ncbi:MAG: protoporphyrinogen oxidase [Parachlamydiaceae bacterium]
MKSRIVIVGAGISGLALGWFLKQRLGNQIDLKIVEASDRVGGWIRTNQCGDFLFEAGPRSCRARGKAVETLQLIEDLGLADQVITASTSATTRYLYADGSLQQLPKGVFSLLTSPLMRGILPSLWREWSAPSSFQQDESIADFVDRRFGGDIAERFFDPLVSGIYAGDIRRLSVRSCFPEMYRLEQESGSIVGGLLKQLLKRKIKGPPRSAFVEKMLRSPIFSFQKGMATLTDRLGTTLRDELLMNCKVVDMNLSAKNIEVCTDTQGTLHADHIFLATPAHATATILRSISPQLVDQIMAMPSTTVAVVNLGWNKKVLNREGFGYLVPTREQEEVLGVVWDSSVFPHHNLTPSQTRLTVMMGGTHHPAIEKISNEEILRRSLGAVSKHLGINVEPDSSHVVMARQAIPQYSVNHHAKMQAIEDNLSLISTARVHLLGSSWGGVSIHDCVFSAKQMSECPILS